MPVDYRDDVRPGEPERARKGQDKGLGGVFTDELGPLPVWGWAAVAVAGVFLWRKMSAKPAPAATPTTTTPAYPAGGDFGPFYVTGQAPGPAAPLPTVAPAAASEWGPIYPAYRDGIVPDRPCKPGTFVVTDYGRSRWSCETYDQISGLMAWLGAGAPGAPPGSLEPGTPANPLTPPPDARSVQCPPGYQLVSAPGGLTCVPLAGSSTQ